MNVSSAKKAICALSIIATLAGYSQAEIVPGSPTPTSSSPVGVGISRVREDAWPEPPVYELKPEHIESLRLSKEQEDALHNYKPNFKPWSIEDYPAVKHYPYSKTQLPYVVKGDFDGNGKSDLIIAGHEDKNSMVLAIMGGQNSYFILPVNFNSGSGLATSPELATLHLIKKGIKLPVDFNKFTTNDTLPHDSVYIVPFDSNYSGEFCMALDNNTGSLYWYEEKFTMLPAEIYLSSSVPSVFKPEYTKKIALSPAMEKVAHAFTKDFKMWTSQDYPAQIIEEYPYSPKSLPYAVKGDFNGDNIDDMVIAGHDDSRNLVLALLSSTSGYSVAWTDNSGPCYSESRDKGKQLPYLPSEVLRYNPKGLEFSNLENIGIPQAVHLNQESFSIQTIRSCEYSNGYDEHEAPNPPICGDWHNGNSDTRAVGYIKGFFKDQALFN